MIVREATDLELAGWHERTVARPGGDVHQSRPWGEHRARAGWRPRYLVFEDGLGILALERSWPVIGGGSAYLPRGPIANGEPAAVTAGRLAAATAWLAARGMDVVATDAEIPAESGYPALLAGLGFHPIEEIEPSRHRLSLDLADVDEERAMGAIARPTRQRIRQAEAAGIRVVRIDARATSDAGPGFAPGPDDPAAREASFRAFHELVVSTGERRGFRLVPLADFLDWWRAAYAAGYLVHLEARLPDAGQPVIAGLALYRHGGRLSTAYSGDRPDARATSPGVFHLLRWRAIQLAIRERCAEMDLGGVDVVGARHEPRPGEPMYGLYQHKRSFGARWVELSGAHERVVRPRHRAVGRAAGAASRPLRTLLRRVRGGAP